MAINIIIIIDSPCGGNNEPGVKFLLFDFVVFGLVFLAVVTSNNFTQSGKCVGLDSRVSGDLVQPQRWRYSLASPLQQMHIL